MRTDATIDGRAVVCANSSLIGHSGCTARVGSFLATDEGMARMIGRVKYAPAIGEDTKPVRNFILALVLESRGQFVMERWIDPATVRAVYENPPVALAAFFFAPKLPYDVHTLRRLNEYGTLQNQHIDHIADTVAHFAERDAKIAA